MAEVNKGITISFRGDSVEFDNSIDGINKALKTLKKDTSALNKELKFDPTNADKLETKLGNLKKQEELLTEKMKIFKDQLNDLGKIDTKEKEKEFERISKEIQSCEQGLLSVNQQMKKMDSEPAKDMADGMKDASSSALSFGDVLKANIVSDVIISGVKALASAFVELGSSLVNTMRESGAFADDVNTLAKQYNLSTSELQAYIRTSQLIDVELTTITKSMAKLTKNMTSTSSGVVGAFQQLGVATTETDGSLRDSNVVFNEVIEALGNIQNETEQDSIAMEIFGKSAADLGSLINGGAQQLKELNKYLTENNLILSQDELDSLNQVNDSFDTLDMAFSSFKDKLASKLAPAIQPILDSFVGTAEKFAPLIENLVDKLVVFITEHQEDFIGAIDSIFEWMTSDDTAQFFTDVFDLFKETAEFIGILKELNDELDYTDYISKQVDATIRNIKNVLADINDLFTGNATLRDIIWRLFARGIIEGENMFNSGGFNGMDTKGFNGMNSGGFASGGITMTNNFTINNANNITQAQVEQWSSWIADSVNERLGEMI